MFKKLDTDLIEIDNEINAEVLDDFDPNYQNNQSILGDESRATSHSKYRANYPFDSQVVSNDDFFKSLEDNARSNQKTTIGRPQSVFTDSSFSLPTGYYEQTTPYGDFNGDKTKRYKLDGKGNTNEGTSNNKDLFDDDDGSFNAFENDDDLDDIIEAFNPNVKVRGF